MTFSVAKSYLAVLAGLAVSDGLISSVDQPVGATVRGPWFASAHNARITWRHLLHQASEWQGELWGKPDQSITTAEPASAPTTAARVSAAS